MEDVMYIDWMLFAAEMGVSIEAADAHWHKNHPEQV
jgi:hypothetical protein